MQVARQGVMAKASNLRPSVGVATIPAPTDWYTIRVPTRIQGSSRPCPRLWPRASRSEKVFRARGFPKGRRPGRFLRSITRREELRRVDIFRGDARAHAEILFLDLYRLH